MDRSSELMAQLDPCRADLKDVAAEDIGAPAFGEPWHAQVFGIAMAMAQAGHFSWATWVETFSTEIRAHPQMPGETAENAYYRQWEAALSTLLAKLGAADEVALSETSEHWRRSFLATEHGKPIIFRRDLPKPAHDHVHHHHHHAPAEPPRPVAVSSTR